MGDLSAYCVWPGTSVLLPTFPIASHWIFHVYRKHSSFDSILIKLFYISWMIEMDKLQLLEGEILSFCDVRLKQQISSVPKKKIKFKQKFCLHHIGPAGSSWYQYRQVTWCSYLPYVRRTYGYSMWNDYGRMPYFTYLHCIFEFRTLWKNCMSLKVTWKEHSHW